MGWNRMQELKEKESNEILMTITNPQSGFDKELEEDYTENSERLALVLRILAQACECSSSPRTLIEVANMLLQSKCIQNAFLSRFLATLSTKPDPRRSRTYLNTIKNILRVFKTLLTVLPTSLMMILPPLVMIKHLCIRSDDSDFIDDDVQILCAEVDSLRESVEEEQKRRSKRRDRKVDRNDIAEDLLEPPNDFAEMSIFPELGEIHMDEEPFLRVNKAKGKYQNARHYLDVQFRLIKEDFVSPLREGIQVYLDSKNRRLPPNTKLQNIRVYENVYILGPVCIHSGIAYRLQFDVEKLKNIRWQSSKRLIYGSLLCMSKDNFNTMYFCTVTNRNTDDLANGKVDVLFEHQHDKVRQFQPDDKFCMAETSAYFEAYRHVLNGLQKMAQEDFPFQKYIVRCESEVSPPQYLQANPDTTYDMGSLVQEKKTTNPEKLRRIFARAMRIDGIDFGSDSDNDSDGSFSEPEEENNDTPRHLKAVPVLDHPQWPSAEDLKLDQAQHRALQVALSQEFSIIQGPPGTGKTFLGWKMVQVLLKNRHVWSTNPHTREEEKRPILTVCYTNHALDQFLEGIQHFHDRGIVRVGGRSKSKSLEKHFLNNLRQTMKASRRVPAALHSAFREIRWGMENVKKEIDQTTVLIEIIDEGVLHLDVLEEVISEEMLEQLEECPVTDIIWIRSKKRFSPLMEWLGLGVTVVEDLQLDQMDQQFEAQAQAQEEEDESVEVEEEIDHINEQRMLGDDNDDDEQSKSQKEWERMRKEMQLQKLEVNLQEQEEFKAQGSWQLVGSSKQQRKQRKKKEKQLKRRLNTAEPLTQVEVDELGHVWTIPLHRRWQLYKYWINKYKNQLRDHIRIQEIEYHNTATRLKEVRDQLDLEIMREATVLGMTTTGAARYHSVLQDIKPRIIIVEEAAEVLESHVVTTLSDGCEHLILIGDHKQLRPSPTVYELAQHYNLDLSLFERMVNNGIKCVTLAKQHRMRPEIANLVAPIYPELVNDESVMNYDHIKGVSKDIYFISHSHQEEHNEELKSKSNYHEAKYAVGLCRYLLLQGYAPDRVTILTTYSGQLFKLKRLMPKKQFEGVRVSVVDNYQGEENDIVILSLVRSNTEGSIGFLSIDNRVCVSMSRARMGFYVIGNFDLLQEQSQLWKAMCGIMERKECLGDALPLYCQNHPQEVIHASTAKDFDKAPEGGCMLPCETRLVCGHVCPRACHTYDREHESVQCQKRCNKVICPIGHRCGKKCFEDCGDCQVPLEKLMVICGHRQVMPCHKRPETWSCRGDCVYKLPCGHPCRNRCGDDHTNICLVIVKRKWPCGHLLSIQCHQTPGSFTCNKRCRSYLECTHPCRGTCGTCHQGRLHESCFASCERTLVCGHLCREPCTSNCPPCSAKCQNRCRHSKCPKRCGDPCDPCKEPCVWRCQHFQCTMLCSEPCDRPPCDQPCPRRLNCGHMCIGLCGEPCPEKCRICHRDIVQEIFFGTEEEEGACFVQLEDCGHILEVTGLDQWMNTTEDETGKTAIQLKCCPKCKVPIHRNLRYSNQINSTLKTIEVAKQKVCGDQRVIAQKKREVARLLGQMKLNNPDFTDNVKKLLSHKKMIKQVDSSDEEEDPIHHQSVEKCVLEKNLSLSELAALQNLSNFFKATHKLMVRVLKEKSNLKTCGFAEEANSLKIEIQSLLDWVLNHQLRVSIQEASEFVMEQDRLSLLLKFTMMNVLATKLRKTARGSSARNYDEAIEVRTCN